jgi:hypothetical protein
MRMGSRTQEDDCQREAAQGGGSASIEAGHRDRDPYLPQFDAAVALGERRADGARGRDAGAQGGRIGDRSDRAGDGWQEPAAVRRGGQLLGSWISASTVLGTPRPGTEPEGGTLARGEVRPAA